jgi:hypothetical protein
MQHIRLGQRYRQNLQVCILTTEGLEIPVRLRLLGFDCCEFESDHRFASDELVMIYLYRMGYIRARIMSQEDRICHAVFDQNCSV